MMIIRIYKSMAMTALFMAKHAEIKVVWSCILTIIYCFNCKIIMTLYQFDHWEGQFVKITGGGLSKDVIIGNIY